MWTERRPCTCPFTAPTPAHTVVQQNSERFRGNPSATINSSIEGGSAGSSALGSDDRVNGSEPVVLEPCRAKTTTSGGGNRCITVTLERPVSGKRKLTVRWRFVSGFTPTIDDKNIVCLV